MNFRLEKPKPPKSEALSFFFSLPTVTEVIGCHAIVRPYAREPVFVSTNPGMCQEVTMFGDAALRQAAKSDFQQRRGDRPFVSAIPDARKTPRGLPPFLVKTGGDELLSQVQAP